ncbi:MAG: hypothetical protein MJ124_08650 [Lachnospiraceae bacterium]|nr:hypothetical protein [Lachnospiraceae bacterium]
MVKFNKLANRIIALIMVLAMSGLFSGCLFGQSFWYERQNLEVQKGTKFSGTLITGNTSDSIDFDGVTNEKIDLPYVLTLSEKKSDIEGYYQLVATYEFDISEADAWLVMPGMLDKYTGKLFTFGSSVGYNSNTTCIQSFTVGKKTYQALASSYFDKDAGMIVFEVDIPEEYDGLWLFLSTDDMELEQAIVEMRGNNNYFDESPYGGKAGEVLETYTQYWFEYDRPARPVED